MQLGSSAPGPAHAVIGSHSDARGDERRLGEAPAHEAGLSVSYVAHTGGALSEDVRRWLTPADTAEYAGIRHAATRDRSLATRARLRCALSEATEERIGPLDWAFERTAYGAPILAARFPSVHFSCSHTAGLSVVAVSTSGPIGIDIEHVVAGFDHHSVAEYFTEAERASLNSAPQDAQTERCIGLWTMKEAVSKLLGTGLALPFSQLELDLNAMRLTPRCALERELPDLRLTQWHLSHQGQRLAVCVAVRTISSQGTVCKRARVTYADARISGHRAAPADIKTRPETSARVLWRPGSAAAASSGSGVW